MHKRKIKKIGADDMDNWKKVNVSGVAKIEKCVAEFNIHELEITPWGKYKIKIYEDSSENYTGYTNLMISTKYGTDCGVGHGNTIEEALEDTLHNFMEMVNDENVKSFVFSENTIFS